MAPVQITYDHHTARGIERSPSWRLLPALRWSWRSFCPIELTRLCLHVTYASKIRAHIPSALDVSGAARPGAHVLRVSIQLDGVEALLVVRSHRTQDDVQLDVLCGAYTQSGLGADARGADIERVPHALRDPGLSTRTKQQPARQ